MPGAVGSYPGGAFSLYGSDWGLEAPTILERKGGREREGRKRGHEEQWKEGSTEKIDECNKQTGSQTQ